MEPGVLEEIVAGKPVMTSTEAQGHLQSLFDNFRGWNIFEHNGPEELFRIWGRVTEDSFVRHPLLRKIFPPEIVDGTMLKVEVVKGGSGKDPDFSIRLTEAEKAGEKHYVPFLVLRVPKVIPEGARSVDSRIHDYEAGKTVSIRLKELQNYFRPVITLVENIASDFEKDYRT